jgi:hypothetical protein
MARPSASTRDPENQRAGYPKAEQKPGITHHGACVSNQKEYSLKEQALTELQDGVQQEGYTFPARSYV